MSITDPNPGIPRSRAVTQLVVAAVVVFVVLFVVAVVAAVALNGGFGGGASTSPTPAGVPAVGGAPSAAPAGGTGGWDTTRQQELAAAAMPVFPVAAAQPHQLAITPGGVPLAASRRDDHHRPGPDRFRPHPGRCAGPAESPQ